MSFFKFRKLCLFSFLCRYELSCVKSELQNKYHAELEILREDYENKIDLINVENETRLQNIERKYIDKIEILKFDLDEALKGTAQLSISSAVQEVVSVFHCLLHFSLLVVAFQYFSVYSCRFIQNY